MDPRPRCKTVKLLDDSKGKSLDDLGYACDFLHTLLKGMTVKEISDQVDFIQMKNFGYVKDIVEKKKTGQ